MSSMDASTTWAHPAAHHYMILLDRHGVMDSLDTLPDAEADRLTVLLASLLAAYAYDLEDPDALLELVRHLDGPTCMEDLVEDLTDLLTPRGGDLVGWFELSPYGWSAEHLGDVIPLEALEAFVRVLSTDLDAFRAAADWQSYSFKADAASWSASLADCI